MHHFSVRAAKAPAARLRSLTASMTTFAVLALGGGAAFGLLSRDPSPMVGASGLAFGLAGALVAREAARWQAALAVRP